MNKVRLLRSAQHLEDVVAHLPRERFDMAHWAKYRLSCGTACCAVGHCCDIPEFAEAGLSMKLPRDFQEGIGTALPMFAGSDGSAAVRYFYGISADEVDYLFTQEAYWDDLDWKPDPGDERRVEPLDVAQRIRDFVASKETVIA